MKPRWVEPAVTALAAGAARALATTWRFRTRGVEHWRSLREAERPFVFALWHSRILPLLFHHRHQEVVILVSRHRDGGYLVALSERWGYRPVRGSSRRGGEVGLLGVVRSLEEGAVVAITPDGPRGPPEQVKPGAVAAAQHAGVPIVPVAARPSAAWWVSSWDRFCVPKPFATVEIVYGPAITVRPGREGLRQGIADVQRGLQTVTHGP